MDELEDAEKEFYRRIEAGRKEHERFMQQPVETRIIVCLEGVKYHGDQVDIAQDLKMERSSVSDRQVFFDRAKAFNKEYVPTENNEFFLIHDAIHVRDQAPGPGERVMIISAFLAVCSKYFIDVTIGQSLFKRDGMYQSTGFYKTPFDSRSYEMNVVLTETDMEQLRTMWPIFRDKYVSSPFFRLVSRRFYLSLTRSQWEDELIDLIIVMEAFLTPDVTTNRPAKIAKRLSLLLIKHSKRGETVFIVKACYDVRNRVVHGEFVANLENNARPVIKELSKFVRLALQEYLQFYKGVDPGEFVREIDELE